MTEHRSGEFLANFGGLSVGGQALSTSDDGCGLREFHGLGIVKGDDRDGLEEFMYADAGVESRGAGGRHDVAGSGYVVAEDFVREFADEYGARVLDLPYPGPRFTDGETHMLRGE